MHSQHHHHWMVLPCVFSFSEPILFNSLCPVNHWLALIPIAVSKMIHLCMKRTHTYASVKLTQNSMCSAPYGNLFYTLQSSRHGIPRLFYWSAVSHLTFTIHHNEAENFLFPFVIIQKHCSRFFLLTECKNSSRFNRQLF